MKCLLSSSGRLGSLVATIHQSPILVRLSARHRHYSASEWARVHHSPKVDDYVLAWIATKSDKPIT
jgi:hypothetical protein